jgi:hypothetical protein
VEAVMQKNKDLGPRQMMEAFIDKIIEQSKEIAVYTANEVVENKEMGTKDDGNDGMRMLHAFVVCW